MSRHLRKYKINPNIKKMIEDKVGKKPMSYMMIENMVKNILKGKYNKDIELLEEDKDKIIGLLKVEGYTPNGYSDEINNNLANFLIENFIENEYMKFINQIVDRSYRPGETYNNIRINNDTLLNFLSNFSNIEKVNGIIINSEFIGDVKKFYEDVEYNEETLELTDDKITDKLNIFINSVNNYAGKEHIEVYTKDNIYIITTTNPYVVENMKDTKFHVFENLPKYYFEDWK